MKIIVTCGPSYEPIDEVRRITNFSTGALGSRLASALAEAGHEVICLKGVASTTLERVSQAETIPFTTNADLLERLEELGQTRSVGAIFHAAALADFRVHWEGVGRRKISSREGPITLTLVPAEKVMGKLRGYFPQAKLIGWKYELDGGMEELLEKGERQMVENHTDY
jgi:phosphopantothenoylcysteine synthetase/decarboxylase